MAESTGRSQVATGLRALIVAVLLACAVGMVAVTYRWPLVWDAQVMHYANFLIQHGFAPYRDITDMNLPGAYLIEGAAMKVFGGGDMAWRMYDFFLLGTITAAAIAIARSYDWVAGLFAGVMFALVHETEGPTNGGQRDEAMTALMLAGYAFLFASVRQKKPWMMLAFGLSIGAACSVKPTVAPTAILLLGMAWWNLKKQDESAGRFVLTGLAGMVVAGSASLIFLWHYHAMGAFLDISHRVTPYYASLQSLTFMRLVRISLPRVTLLMLPFALVVAVTARLWRSWEQWALLLGVATGAFSYFAQRKGYQYHRYMYVEFLLLWMGIELALAIRKPGAVRVVGFAGIVLGGLIFPAVYMRRVYREIAVNQYSVALQNDLTRLGGRSLDRKVQCLDLVDGCMNALYHLGLVSATGSLGDLLYFPEQSAPAVEFYRARFFEELKRNQPEVFVLSSERFGTTASFDKVKAWPAFAAYLEANYRPVVQRYFAQEQDTSYRIYVLKDMAVPRLDPGYGWTPGT